MYIFIDLDGPILDNKRRLYQLYIDLLRPYGIKPLPEKVYWQLKRARLPEKTILNKNSNLTEKEIHLYLKKRIRLIETRQYLKLNRVVVGCYNSLKLLSKQGKLVLVTTRRNQTNLYWELREKKLLSIFNKVLSSYSDTMSPEDLKRQLIIKNYPDHDRKSIIIGDTEAEILCGKNLGIYSVAVTNGIRNSNFLSNLKPDAIYRDINEASKNIYDH